MSERCAKGTVKWVLIVVIIGVLAAIAIPNFLRFSQRSPHAEARQYLRNIYVAEMAFHQKHGRYGTFDEIGFDLAGHSTRFTYRIDHSGKPGTMIPAKEGALTPDNIISHAAISPDGQHFTATATANLDKDSTLDQWHVTDWWPSPIHDVNDRTS